MRLLDPLPLGRDGRHVAPSRVVFGPHETNLGDGRALSDRHVAYYARRAAGGAGIVVTEEASVHESDHPYEHAPLASQCGPGWRAVVDAVAATGGGSLVLAGLGHSGGQGTSHWNQRPMWAPSAVPEVASREVPKVMEAADIAAVIDGFRDAARLAVTSGCHGVEVNAGQLSLVRQFLSGLTNMRGDGYGSDRSRFAREVLAAVREGAGPEAIVALRLSVDELAPWAGIVPEAGAEIACELAPMIDLITVVRGSIFTVWATRPDMHVEPGFAIGLARTVRDALLAAGHGVPVVAQGSIVEWGQAEWAIDDGAADAVEMTRAQLADADLVAHLRAGSSARIRPCILCNQTCKVRDNRNPIVTCVLDPRTGHETEDPAIPIAPLPRTGRRVTVVGAGVAGMEAARVAALHGADVRVLERTDRTGGVLHAAASAPGRERLATTTDWLRNELDTFGVVVETGHEVTTDELEQLDREGGVIVATGGTHGTLPFTVHEGATVRHAVEVLGGATLPDGPVVVWDPIGGPIAIATAERLASAGRAVTLVTPDLLVGEKLALTGDLAPAQNRLHGNGIRLVKRAQLRAVHADRITVEDRFGGGTHDLECRAVVACGHRLPDTAVDPDEHRPQAGDRVAPRTIHEAVLEGRRAALAALGITSGGH